MKYSIWMGFAAGMLAGCTGLSTVSYPLGDGRYHVMRTLSDPHAMVASPQRNWLEICQDDTLKNCVVDGPVETTWSSGYISGLAGPVIYGASFAGGMHLLGRGIAKSGSSTVNQSGSQADLTSNQTTTQHQTVTVPGQTPPPHYRGR